MNKKRQSAQRLTHLTRAAYKVTHGVNFFHYPKSLKSLVTVNYTLLHC